MDNTQIPPADNESPASTGSNELLENNGGVSTPIENNNYRSQAKHVTSSLKIIIGLIVGIIILLSASTLMYAYGVLPAGNYTIRDAVAHVIMSIPFFPKTPQYVLENAGLVLDNVHSLTYDITFTSDLSKLDLGSYNSYLNLGKINAEVNGAVDATNQNNPSSVFDLALTPDSNVEFRIVNQKVYFIINSLPASWTSTFQSEGITSDVLKPYLHQWYYIPLTSTSPSTSTSSQDAQAYSKFFNNPDVSKEITMTSENGVYHVRFTPDASALDQIPSSQDSQKLSSEVNDVSMDLWIDGSTYDVQKITINFNYIIPSDTLTSTSQTLPVSMQILIPHVNVPVSITAPKNAQDYTNLLELIVGISIAHAFATQ